MVHEDGDRLRKMNSANIRNKLEKAEKTLHRLSPQTHQKYNQHVKPLLNQFLPRKSNFYDPSLPPTPMFYHGVIDYNNHTSTSHHHKFQQKYHDNNNGRPKRKKKTNDHHKPSSSRPTVPSSSHHTRPHNYPPGTYQADDGESGRRKRKHGKKPRPPRGYPGLKT